jgi:hypothetical protein
LKMEIFFNSEKELKKKIDKLYENLNVENR